MPSRERLRDFIATVERGEFVRAIEDFYHEDGSMQENGAPPRIGRDFLVETEKKVLSDATIVTRPVEHYLLDGDRVVINWVFEITGKDGKMRTFDELALQFWDGDRIRRERFYYDPAQFSA
jgi:ketosteroid isomerase-like protein